MGGAINTQRTQQLQQARAAELAAARLNREPAVSGQQQFTLDQEAVDAAARQYREAVAQVGQSLQQAKAGFKAALSGTKTKNLPTLLKSRALYRAFAKVTGMIESALHLQKGRLRPAFMNTPFIVRTERALADSKAVLDKMQELNALLEKQPEMESDTHKRQVSEKLDQLRNSLDTFLDALDCENMSQDEIARYDAFFDMGNKALDVVDEMEKELAGPAVDPGARPAAELNEAPGSLPAAEPLLSSGIGEDGYDAALATFEAAGATFDSARDVFESACVAFESACATLRAARDADTTANDALEAARVAYLTASGVYDTDAQISLLFADNVIERGETLRSSVGTEAQHVNQRLFNSAVVKFDDSKLPFKASLAAKNAAGAEYDTALAAANATAAELNALTAAHEIAIGKFNTAKAEFGTAKAEYNAAIAKFEAAQAEHEGVQDAPTEPADTTHATAPTADGPAGTTATAVGGPQDIATDGADSTDGGAGLAALQALQPAAQQLSGLEYDLEHGVANWSAGLQLAETAEERQGVIDELARGYRMPLEQLQRDLQDQLDASADPDPALAQLKQAVDADLSRITAYLDAAGKRQLPGALPPRDAVAPTAMAILADMGRNGVKLDRIHINLNGPGVTDTHYCSKPSPGKPAELNPLFYHERQQQQLCLKHSLNVFLGGEVFTDKSLAESVRNEKVNSFKNEIAEDPVKFAREWGWMAQGGIITADFARNNPQAAAELAADGFFMMMTGGQSIDQYVRGGNSIEMGIAALQNKARELGLTETRLQDFRGAGQQADMVAYLQETENNVDRMIVGNMTHFLAFRKNEAGDWFMINSNTPQQVRQKPSEYVRENPIGRLTDNSKQYQFLTFTGGEFVPNIKPDAKAPMGASLV